MYTYIGSIDVKLRMHDRRIPEQECNKILNNNNKVDLHRSMYNKNFRWGATTALSKAKKKNTRTYNCTYLDVYVYATNTTLAGR